MMKQKLELALRNIPYHTQQNFRIALKKNKLTSEQFIPKNYQQKKKIKTEDNIMLNTLINFHKKNKKKKKLMNDITKETSNFSKSYFGIQKLKDTKQKEKIIFEDLFERYYKKGYKTNNLFVGDDLFNESLLIHKNYENILKLNEGNDEYLNSSNYLNQLDNIIKQKQNKKKKIFKISNSLKKESLKKKEYENLYPPDYDFKKNNLLLKYDIYKTKSTLDQINLSDRPNYNSTYYNLITSSRTSYFNQSKYNTTFNSNSTTNNIKNDLSDNIRLKNDSTSIDNTIDNKTNEIKKTIFIRNDKNNNAILMKQLLHNEMINDLTKLYNNIKTKKFDDYEDDVYVYLNKYNKQIPEKLK